MIDIIIPCYNTKERFLIRLLSSILCQSIVDDCNVVLVNDASDTEYSEMYSRIMNLYIHLGLKITMFALGQNSGAATARQFALDNTDSEFITFADSDDAFHTPNALEILRHNMTDNVDIVSAQFMELASYDNLRVHGSDDDIWVFSKLFRRSFLQENNIRFTEGRRANEDSEFNFIARLYTDRIAFVDDIVYEWLHNEDSIVCHDNRIYTVDQSFIGMCEIVISINERYGDIFREKIDELIINRMVHAYYGCIMSSVYNPEFVEQSMYYAHKMYHYCWRKDFDKELIRKIFSILSITKYDRTDMVIPYMSFPQFLEFFEQNEFKEDEIKGIQERLWNYEALKPMFENNIKVGSVPRNYYD